MRFCYTSNNWISTIIITLAFGTSLNIDAQVKSESTILHQPTNFSIHKKEFKQALTEIEKKYGVVFVYDAKLVPENKFVTIQTSNKTLGTVLDALLGSFKIDYSVKGNLIILRPAGKEIATAVPKKEIKNQALHSPAKDKVEKKPVEKQEVKPLQKYDTIVKVVYDTIYKYDTVKVTVFDTLLQRTVYKNMQTSYVVDTIILFDTVFVDKKQILENKDKAGNFNIEFTPFIGYNTMFESSFSNYLEEHNSSSENEIVLKDGFEAGVNVFGKRDDFMFGGGVEYNRYRLENRFTSNYLRFDSTENVGSSRWVYTDSTQYLNISGNDTSIITLYDSVEVPGEKYYTVDTSSVTNSFTKNSKQDWLVIPIYLGYSFSISPKFNIDALLGVRFAFLLNPEDIVLHRYDENSGVIQEEAPVQDSRIDYVIKVRFNYNISERMGVFLSGGFSQNISGYSVFDSPNIKASRLYFASLQAGFSFYF